MLPGGEDLRRHEDQGAAGEAGGEAQAEDY